MGVLGNEYFDTSFKNVLNNRCIDRVSFGNIKTISGNVKWESDNETLVDLQRAIEEKSIRMLVFHV